MIDRIYPFFQQLLHLAVLFSWINSSVLEMPGLVNPELIVILKGIVCKERVSVMRIGSGKIVCTIF